MADETKKCPECAETIKADAVICRFCKYDFATGQGARNRPEVVSMAPKRGGLHPAIIVVIVLACGVPFIAIIAAIAIPGLLSSQRAANERNASASLKTLASAEADFRANDRDNNKINDFWTADVRSLYTFQVNGSPIRLIEETVAQADASPGGTGAPVAKAGYLFAAIQVDDEGQRLDQGKGRNPMRFAFCAYPANPSSGRRVFIINEDNTIWTSMTHGPRPVSAWPSDPAAAGWMKLD